MQTFNGVFTEHVLVVYVGVDCHVALQGQVELKDYISEVIVRQNQRRRPDSFFWGRVQRPEQILTVANAGRADRDRR